tara:strand:+ start:1778 stop:3586 length:1809 start_codon:yes stop_codon:yes gene_type:complete
MCGVVGFTSKKRNIKLISELMEKLSHRGPDNKDYIEIKFGNSYLYLGSTRLSIRGDETCNMPLSNEDGNVIIYNGEIFDIKTLSNDFNLSLEKNDTYFLLESLSKKEFNLNQVNGMYAFAFYNKLDDQLILARDRLGIKPLWYSFQDDDIFFSSEQNNLLALIEHKELSNKSIYNSLIFNGLSKGEGIFEEIKQLSPGHKLTLNSDKTYSIEKFNLSRSNGIEDQSNLFNKFENLMIEVLNDHLQADTEVDLLLSGGIDSGILAYLTKNKLKKNLRHFSVKFENKSFDESNTFQKLSKKLELDPIVFEIKNNDIPAIVNDALENMNSLVLDPSFIPTHFLSKKTSNYTKAVISGDGADEIFGGYEWYRAIKIKEGFPFFDNGLVAKFLKFIFENNNSTNYLGIPEKINSFYKSNHDDPLIQTLIWQSSLQNINDEVIEIIYQNVNSYTDLFSNNSLQNLDMNFYMYTNIIPKIDIAGMANGLEIRPPYLDDRIIEFGKNIKTHTSLFKTKLFLREYIKNTDISFLNSKKKHGFAFPLSVWFKLQGYDYLKNKLKSNNKFLDFLKTKEDLSFLNSKLKLNNNELRLAWSIYVILNWLDKNEIN